MIFKSFLFFLFVYTLNSAALPNGRDVERLGQLIATTFVRKNFTL